MKSDLFGEGARVPHVRGPVKIRGQLEEVAFFLPSHELQGSTQASTESSFSS